MIERSELLEAKRLHGWVIILANEQKSPALSGKWKSFTTQTEEELLELVDRVGDRASCWGPVCGIGELFSFDFDWAFIYGLFHRHFGERAQTLTYKTPNTGARPFYLTKEKTKGDPFESSLHVEFKGSHFVACGGHAHNVDGELRPYTLVKDQPIRRDDQILQDSTKFFHELLEGRYSWLKYKCIKKRLNQHSKRIVIGHPEGRAINIFMIKGGCDDWEIHNFRRALYDYDKGKYSLEYNESMTNAQIKSTRSFVEKGGLPHPCTPKKSEKTGKTSIPLYEIFDFDPKQCDGCPRKKVTPKKKRKTKKTDPEEELNRKKESLALLGDKYVFATPDDVEILYLYKDGKYVPGKTIVNEDIEEQHGDDASSGLCGAVVGHFKRRSYRKRTDFNKFDNFMPVENGLLNLDTFELTPHTSDKIFTFKLETSYRPDKKAPKFMKFINEVITNEEDLLVVQEFAGYTLLPAFPHHNFLILVGTGRNGKGALVRTIRGILGDDNVSQIRLENLDGKHRFAVANLFGKLMNSCSEPSTKALRTEILKNITGQDRVDGEIKNKQNPLRFTPFAKWFILANQLPPVADTTPSFWDRLLLVEFTQSFTDEKGNKIPDIERQWLDDPDERSGVLNWMMEGLIRLQKQGGFTQTKTMKQKKLEYKKVSDSIGAFLADEEQCNYGSILWILRSELYDAYKAYAEEHGLTIESSGKFIARVKLLPNVVDRKKRVAGKSQRIWRGIGLVSPLARPIITLDPEEEEEEVEEESGADGADEAPVPNSLSPDTSTDTSISSIQEKDSLNPQLENGAPPAPSAPLSDEEDSERAPLDIEEVSLNDTGDTDDKDEDTVSTVSSSEEDSLEALERRTLVIEEAVRILEEASGEIFQKMLFDELKFRGYSWEEASPILRADPQFNFRGMMVALRDVEEERERTR